MFAVTGLGILLVCLGGFPPRQLPTSPDRRARRRSAHHPQWQDRSPLRNRARRAGWPGVSSQFALNQLMGVQEDDTDEEGRPSRPPAASDFSGCACGRRALGFGVQRRHGAGVALARVARIATTAAFSASTSLPNDRSAIPSTTSPKQASSVAFAPAKARCARSTANPSATASKPAVAK